jgi:uncharacterized protein (TIGR02270 family)
LVDVNLIIPDVVAFHAQEAAILMEARDAVLTAPHVRLRDLQRGFDDRIAAHFDGLSIAGEHAWPLCETSLEDPSPGAVFAAAVLALSEKRDDRLDRLFALAGAVPPTRAGLVSALGWVERDQLQGIGAALLASPDTLKHQVGLAACSLHRVDPGLVSGRWLSNANASVRACALRLVGEIGCDQAAPAADAALDDADPECAFWAAWSSVMLGNRGAALDALAAGGLADGSRRREAFRLSLQALSPVKGHRLLKRLAHDPAHRRWLIQGSGLAGDPAYVPWLLKQMRDVAFVPVAGEAFSLITGVDFVDSGLDTKPPGDVETGPSASAEDLNVEMNEDEGLPWPHADRVEAWWGENASRFHPGTRYFMGAPVTWEHCVEVLKTGYQRQRILAAHYLCLLRPGTPLFNTSAPAWRQQRSLAKLS